ncbi:double-strand break repair helicase AddA [Paracoccus aminophilus]|uniref:DNA 3'-5' helicase n=1 Tax=Paracoccus aminophilus JCM 7686 TaxID=1367847 RepID=S5XSQ3_PARAH|nr:double-strand break repair helicase AddA [Paracoccus aminophilus]AGT10474.1 ATP-dependent DNA helicase, AddA [Paracoccus aminophilus JCM 7686]
MMDEATLAQVRAADPGRSTWLTANAGSGKTRVLTDRVARLLLAGTAPERILCLTYTKAAATEMQNRLLKRLGEWAMLPEPKLIEALAALGETTEPDLPAARRLFARAIETPGGLRVQTIHSFCAGVLRRFPLEAGVPHGFSELDDRTAALIRSEIIEEMAQDNAPELQDLLALHSGDRIDGFLAGLKGFDAHPDEAEVWIMADLPPGYSWADLRSDVFPGGRADVITNIIPALSGSGANDSKAAAKLAAGDWAQPGMAEVALLEGVLLTGSGAKEPFTAKIGSFPTKGLQSGACAPFMDDLNNLMARVEGARAKRLALAHAEKTLALQRFGHAFSQKYEAAKRASGWLDFDDLIGKTAALLSESSMAQWVLFRLDGGIDHILVDEAQDTSPEQWQVIQRLTDEFTSGEGARPDDVRTLFVVGDPKQSIYSFQGADIAVFEERRQGFAEAFAAVERPMQVLELRHSFRSSTAILSVVDAVFAGEAARGLGDPPRHIAFRTALPGRVDLWPAIPKPEVPEVGDWTDPVDQAVENSEISELARAIAEGIADILGQPIYDAKNNKIRRARAGDILILVQRRSDLFGEIIGALKAARLPVAGADRLKLAAELAVMDIQSVLSVVATPEDDLALAEALRSPLFGLSEDELYRLSSGREGKAYLWQRLRESERHRGAFEVLFDLMGQTGFMRPYDLISRLLIRHNGREKLISRLGVEAEDGIDELLSQALIYEMSEVPSLTGFLVWLEGDDVEVKRQAGSASEEGEGLIRVMTVHGSKGLEAPIVILPDAAKRRPPQEAAVMRMPGAAPVWRGRKDERPAQIAELAAAQTERQMLERKRLLYVGLTRAESWLIVAAAGETGAGEDSWHAQVAAGLSRVEGLHRCTLPGPTGGEILRFSHGDWPEDAPQTEDRPIHEIAEPDWLRRPAKLYPRPARPVAATGLGGAKVIGKPTDYEGDAEAAMLAGTRLHLLLEHLPDLDPEDWPQVARDVLADAEGGLPDDATLADLLAEAAEVISAPDLGAVFDLPAGAEVLREVALVGELPGLGVISGAIDRLIVLPDRVLAVDFKSNREIPDRPEATPLGILRQLAAYRTALAQIYPGRAVEAAVLWTRARRMDVIAEALLDEALVGLDPSLFAT